MEHNEASPPMSDDAVSLLQDSSDDYQSAFSGNQGPDQNHNPLTESGTGESHEQDTWQDDLLAMSSGVGGLSIAGSQSSPPMPSSPPILHPNAVLQHETGKDEHEHELELEDVDVEELDEESESDDEESQAESIDLSPLEYGRSNGLMRDYLAEEYEEVKNLPSETVLVLADTNLPQFSFGEGFKVEERMGLSRDGAALLASISHDESVATIDAMITPMLESNRGSKRQKLEPPILRSDHWTDCKNFATKEGFEIKLEDIRFPLEAVDEENGQGLGWPARFWDIGPHLLEELKKERITIPKDTLPYFAECVRAEWNEQDSQDLWDREVSYKKNTAKEPLTPPLSPAYTKPKPFEPTSSDSAFDVPLVSEASSPTKEELEEIESRILMNDVPTPLRQTVQRDRSPSASSSTYAGDDPVKLGDIYNPLVSMDTSDPPVSHEPQRLRREDLKVEEALTPEGPHISLPKVVRFNDIIEELTMDEYRSQAKTPKYENTFFEEAFGPAAARATQKLEQEKLIEADATARVDVPLMDFSKSDPPWTRFEGHKDPSRLLAMQKSFIKATVATAPNWRRKGTLKLRWSPWDDNQAQVSTKEQIEADETILESFLRFPTDKEIIDSSDLTWKPAGLMILREDEDDEDEIEPGQFVHDAPMEMTSLVKKRKLELEEKATTRNEPNSAKSVVNNGQAMHSGWNPINRDGAGTKPTFRPIEKTSNRDPAPKNDFISAGDKMVIDADQQDFGMLLGGRFSAENSLDNFMEIRGTKKQKLTDSSYLGKKISKPLQKPTTIQNHPLPFEKQPTQAQPLPTPAITSHTTKTSIIIATDLLKQRALIKHLQAHLPSLELVERDFSAHNTTTWMPGTVTRSPIVSPLAAEADLIVSASTGILVTTLQKIKQKLLPGQKGKPAIHNRVEQVSLRYEKLVIFVSEGRQDESTNGLDENDSIAFSEFIGFTIGLETSVSVQFVAGGEETLAKWIAGAIQQCSLPEHQDLIVDETLWELFLRRAGINAFAVQVIIEKLKAPEGVDASSPSKAGQFGLTAFVEMGREERVKRFGGICGRRLLERVSAVVDAKWEI